MTTNALEQNIIKVLKKSRKNRRKTQEEVAEALGVSSKTIYRIESRLVPLTLAMFIELCGLYQIPPDKLIIQAKNLDPQ